MNKQEFIDRLRFALNGKVSPGLVQENVNYYEDYINTEVRKGRTEEEVLESLGDPRLIARTIVDTNGKSESAEYQDAGCQSSGYQGSGWDNGYNVNENTNVKKRGFRIPGWAWAIIVILIIVVIISAVFSVLSFLAPIILPIIVVVFLVKLFRDWLN